MRFSAGRSILPQLLDRAGPLPAVAPVEGQSFERGHIYVAGPDRHMLIREERS
jgi:two-component system, chemotaxis family, protein-glutamate methylesterase/glutaminase